MLSESTRAYIYRIALALLPILTLLGLKYDAALWTALIGAVLVPGMAVANTSTRNV